MRPKAGGPGKPRGRHLHHTISSRLLLGIGREWSGPMMRPTALWGRSCRKPPTASFSCASSRQPGIGDRCRSPTPARRFLEATERVARAASPAPETPSGSKEDWRRHRGACARWPMTYGCQEMPMPVDDFRALISTLTTQLASRPLDSALEGW